MRNVTRAGLALAILSLVGCGSTGVLPVGTASAPPKPEGCPIAVFEAEEDVGRPFEKVCAIDAKTGSSLYVDRSPDGALRKVKAAACQCGADAVILKRLEKKGVSLASWGSSSVSVLAVRYTTRSEADPVYLVPGTKLFEPGGALYGEVVETILGKRGLDGTVSDQVEVRKTNGARVWISLADALKLRAEPPAPAPGG